MEYLDSLLFFLAQSWTLALFPDYNSYDTFGLNKKRKPVNISLNDKGIYFGLCKTERSAFRWSLIRVMLLCELSGLVL